MRSLYASSGPKAETLCNGFYSCLYCNAVIPLKIFCILFSLDTMYSIFRSLLNKICMSTLDNGRGEWEGWDPVNRFNYTRWMAVVTPTDRPGSVCNRCIIEVFGRFCVVTLFSGIFCLCKGFLLPISI